MEDNEIHSTIQSLHEKVNQIRSKTTTTTMLPSDEKNTSVFSGFILKSDVIYYVIVPLIIFFILFFCKPSIIMEEVSIDGKFPEKKRSYKKLIISTLILTVIIVIGIFCYSYTSKKDIQKI